MAKNSDYINSPLQVTPAAPANFIHLVTPDIYVDKVSGKSADPKYSVTIVFDSKDPVHNKYIEGLKALNEETAAELLLKITKGRNAYRTKDLLKPEEDDEGNLTGRYNLKVNTKMKPKVQDSAGNLMADSVVKRAYSGTELRVIMGLKKSVATTQKTVGLTAYLSEVQIVKLVEGISTGGSFGAVEGGYVAPVEDSVGDGAPVAPQF